MLLQRLKEQQLISRKARDNAATLLTTIIGEAEMVGKSAGNRATTDAEVLQILRKFEKNQMENKLIFSARQMQAEVDQADFELEIIRQFLPAKILDQQVEQDIIEVVQRLGLPAEQKSMGAITKELRAKYGDQFDGQQVSRVFKEALTK